MGDRIPGGFYLKARQIKDSWIAHAPPHVREIWDFLLRNANHKDVKVDGTIIKRGQILTSYKEIRNELSWKVGWRVEKYSKNDCETSMNRLRNHTMIHTTKTTRGMLITILNYDKYQNPKNYELYKEALSSHTRVIQTADTINKNEKNDNTKNSLSNERLSGENGNARRIPYSEIVSFLNETCQTKFRPDTATTRNMIKARFNEGFDLEDFKAVISTKAGQWLTEPKMVQYLRPQTLFGTKFESYLTESSRAPVKKETKLERMQREWEEKHGITGSNSEPN